MEFGRGINAGPVSVGAEFSEMVDQQFDRIYISREGSFDEIHFLPRLIVSAGRCFEVRVQEFRAPEPSADLAQKLTDDEKPPVSR